MKRYTMLGFARYYCRMKGIPVKTFGSYCIEVNGRKINVTFYNCHELLHEIDDASVNAENAEVE